MRTQEGDRPTPTDPGSGVSPGGGGHGDPEKKRSPKKAFSKNISIFGRTQRGRGSPPGGGGGGLAPGSQLSKEAGCVQYGLVSRSPSPSPLSKPLLPGANVNYRTGFLWVRLLQVGREENDVLFGAFGAVDFAGWQPWGRLEPGIAYWWAWGRKSSKGA